MTAANGTDTAVLSAVSKVSPLPMFGQGSRLAAGRPSLSASMQARVPVSRQAGGRRRSAAGAAAPRLRVGLQHGALRDGQVGAQARELVLRQAQLHGRHLLLLAQEAHDLLQLAACAPRRRRDP